MPLIPLTEKGH